MTFLSRHMMTVHGKKVEASKDSQQLMETDGGEVDLPEGEVETMLCCM